ncbi:hypothetical protein UZ36_04235 [Candidatus Nitromaritima sp. SCGC AAA799-C22]|nr:hypothetical protein UZ36_04235 [Candidatus Nitromaritima sp. SCGC AAA799-C22]
MIFHAHPQRSGMPGCPLRTGFILLHYLMAAMGLACLVLSETLPSLAGFPLALGLAVCFYLELQGTIPLRPPAKFLLSNWGLLVLPALYLTFDLPLVDLVVWFLIFLMFSRFIYKTELNDYLLGYLISIVCLFIGALFIQDMAFGVLFLGFYLVLCWGLIVFNMMRERTGGKVPPEVFKRPGEREAISGSLMGLSALIILSSLLLTTIIFLTFPRFGLGILALNTNSSPISGFSDTVTLGDVGKIKENETVVMRLEYTKNGRKYRPPQRTLWRGVALDSYDGERWSATVNADWKWQNRPGIGINLFRVQPTVDVVRQEVLMETFDTNVVFTHGIPMYIDGNFRELSMDQSFALKTGNRRPGPKRFVMHSDIGRPDMSYDMTLPHPDPQVFNDLYLQLPPVSDELVGLAQSLVRGEIEPLKRANNILRFFGTGFGYTLKMKAPDEGSALDYFLFQRRKGHCEYFASAMVVLLRLAGVPARMINGFVGTEWNELGEYMIVRQKHAHSWVEAFIPGRGWLLFDPTPPDPGAVQGSSLGRAGLYLDLMRLYWQRYVIRYSSRDQIQFIKFFGKNKRELTQKIKIMTWVGWKRTTLWFRNHPWSVLLVAGGIALAGFLFKRRNEWGFPCWRRTSVPVAVRLYRHMLEKLAKQGIMKKPHWTHREFLDHLAGLPEEKTRLVKTITDYYEQTRFADRSFEDRETSRMFERLKHL